jgi:hypothetical protein
VIKHSSFSEEVPRAFLQVAIKFSQ